MFVKRAYLDQHLNQLLDNPKFNLYYEYLIEVNQVMNLTRIVDIDSVYYKHFYDSIILSNYIDLNNKSLLDVGAGAGFPSIPLKIINDTLNVTIVDSLNKRIGFLETLNQKLALDNVSLIHGRAEELESRNSYDLVTSRAVARLNVLIELTLPFVAVGGYFIAYKALNYHEELEEAKTGIKMLGGKLERIEEYPISDEESHVLIIIKKIKKTSEQYPRIYQKIKNNPL